jgi:hypothetical protein
MFDDYYTSDEQTIIILSFLSRVYNYTVLTEPLLSEIHNALQLTITKPEIKYY